MTRWLGSFWVRAGLTGLILAYLLRQVDGGAALRAMLQVDPGALLVVAVLVLLDRTVMIWRWVLLLRASGTPIETRSAARIFLVSSFVGSFLPAGVGGDAARAYALSQRTAQRGAAVASVAIDRILGVIAIALMGGIGIAAYARSHPDPQVQLVAVASAVAVLVGSVAAVWADRWIRWLPLSWHTWTPVRLPLRIADAVAEYRQQPGTLAIVFALSVLVQLLRILQAFGLGLGLGLTVPFAYYLVFMPIGLLMLLLPISVSGFGLPQGVMVWLLRPLGVPDELSLALTTLIILSGLFGNLPGAWLYLRARRH
jgi:glycosyltransferase 2 family protein